MKEIVIISGKGGTGKTSLTASFGFLAEGNVMADCDVDAADLHILAHPKVWHEEDFSGGLSAVIDPERCTQCGSCREACRFDAITPDHQVDSVACEGCGVCYHVCPENAVELTEPLNGHWFMSETRFGPMVHAALLPGEENSGKLVALVRNQAKVLAEKRDKDLILVDGAPGVGCPVISSVTGADHVLVVTEPSMSGLHDMKRAVELVRGFRIPVSIIVNKHDINPEITDQIEALAGSLGIDVLGKILYDPSVVKEMVHKRCVVENGESPSAQEIRRVWKRIQETILT